MKNEHLALFYTGGYITIMSVCILVVSIISTPALAQQMNFFPIRPVAADFIATVTNTSDGGSRVVLSS